MSLDFCRVMLRLVSVMIGARNPPDFVINTWHVLNVVLRITMIGMACVVAAFIGFRTSSGLAVASYNRTQWRHTTNVEWSDGDIPRMVTLLHPDSMHTPVSWFVIIVIMLTSDIVCVVQKVCYPRGNFTDNHWHISCSLILPLIMGFTAIELGTHDISTILLVITLAMTSCISAAVSENISSNVGDGSLLLTNRYDMQGLVLTGVSVVTLYFSLALAVLPSLMDYFNTGERMTFTHIMLSVLLNVFVTQVVATQFNHQETCSKILMSLNLARYDKHAISNIPTLKSELAHLSMKSYEAQQAQGSQERVAQPFFLSRCNTEACDAQEDKEGEELYKKLYSGLNPCASEYKPACDEATVLVEQAMQGSYIPPSEGPMMGKPLSESAPRVQPLTPAQTFNKLYNTHVYEEEQQSEHSQALFQQWLQHTGESEVMRRSKECCLLVEWRRYYVVSNIINLILFISLLDMDRIHDYSQ